MKILIYPSLLLFVCLVSCKDEQNPVLVAPTEPFADSRAAASLLTETQADITAAKPVFIAFKQLQINNQPYNYTFSEEGELKEVKDTPQTFAFTFLRNDKLLTREFENRKDTYTLDAQQLATEAELNIGVSNNTKRFYFYKDGHRIATVGSTEKVVGIIEKNEFSTAGNLLKRTYADDFFEKNILNYEYTDFPNTIHQEVLGFQLLNINPRTVNLGKFNTNLIKKITIEEGLMKGKTIEFNYEFDTQNRVSKVNIIRDGMPITMEYQY